jgi:DNA-binding NarL/FixJ family response regulator
MIRVFLLDDHEVVRKGVMHMLETEHDIEVVGEASTAAQALARIPAVRPDVAILDVRLPDGDGVSVCRELRSAIDPPPAVLMFTVYSDDEALFQAIMAGASGYLLKRVLGNDLVGAVRRVAAGESLLDPSLVGSVLSRLRQGTDEDPRYAALGKQERRILALIAEGLTNRQIAERVFLSEKTVKNYISGMLRKLGVSSRTAAAMYLAGRTRRDASS